MALFRRRAPPSIWRPGWLRAINLDGNELLNTGLQQGLGDLVYPLGLTHGRGNLLGRRVKAHEPVGLTSHLHSGPHVVVNA